MDLISRLRDGLNIEAYSPLHRRWRKLAKHVARKLGYSRELVTDALISGYLFVRVETDTNADLSAVLEVKEVYGFISNMHGVCYARDTDIETLRQIEASGVHDRIEDGPDEDAVEVKAEEQAAPVPVPTKAVTEALKESLAAMSLVDQVGRMVRINAGPLTGHVGKLEKVVGGSVKIDLVALSVDASAECVELV